MTAFEIYTCSYDIFETRGLLVVNDGQVNYKAGPKLLFLQHNDSGVQICNEASEVNSSLQDN